MYIWLFISMLFFVMKFDILGFIFFFVFLLVESAEEKKKGNK